MNLKEILTHNDPVRLILITMSNKDLEQAFHELLLAETEIDLTFKIEVEYGLPTILVSVLEWKDLSENERLALERLSYSFDFPDEDINDLLHHLFKADDIEIQKSNMASETEFDIDLYIPLEEYERLLTELAI